VRKKSEEEEMGSWRDVKTLSCRWDSGCLEVRRFGWVQWFTAVIPATMEAEVAASWSEAGYGKRKT
jgi:hypothetical protein